jgi:hypothetical protein
MKIRIIALFAVLSILSIPAMADIHGLVDSTPGNVTITAAQAVTPESSAVPLKGHLNSLGIDASMTGRVIPGISYSRDLSSDVFATLFAGAVADADGAELFVSFNAYKMFNEFIYAGLGFSSIFDNGNSVLIGVANPSVGLMSKVTPDIALFAEATGLLFKVRTNNDFETLPDSTILIFKIGAKYYFRWGDPLEDLKKEIVR